MNTEFIPIQELNVDSQEIIKIYRQLTTCFNLCNKQIKKFIKSLPENNKIYGMKVDNNIIGFGTVIIEPKITHNLGHVGHIEDIIISKEYSGKGHGKKLVNFLISIANNYKCYKVILNCSENNILFYEKCGFKQKNYEMSLYF